MKSFKRGVFSLVVSLVALQIVSASASPPTEKKANAPNQLTQVASKYEFTANDFNVQECLIVGILDNHKINWREVPNSVINAVVPIDTAKPVFMANKIYPIAWADILIRVSNKKPIYTEQRLPKFTTMNRFDVRPQKNQGLILIL